jgi:hypothetical protein
VKQHHPDLAQDPAEKKKREEYLKILNLAYETLNDPMKRTQYDQKLSSHQTFTRSENRDAGHTYQRGPSRVHQRRREPPEVLIRGNEHLLRVEYIRRRFQLRHDIAYYIRNRIVSFYTTPDGYIYVPITELEKAQTYDLRGKKAGIPSEHIDCVLCGVTNASLRERYFVHNTGILHMRKMRLRGGVLCSKCRGKEKWRALAHNLAFGWWGIEALVYNLGFITINSFGGFRGRRTTKSLQAKIRKYSVEKKKYDLFSELKGWRAKFAASLPNTLVDQLLYNDHHSMKAALFTAIVIIIIVRIIMAV